jgi:nucleotide-binding universal stress UspA family protein
MPRDPACPNAHPEVIMATSPYKSILVPVDGSPTSRKGLDQALKLAQSLGCSLEILHVIDTVTILAYGELAAYAPQIASDLQAAGAKIVADAGKRAEKAGVPYEGRVLDAEGKAVSAVIVDEAKKRKVSLIAMGTHGRRGLLRAVLGSDAEGVLREAPVPVLLVRGD